MTIKEQIEKEIGKIYNKYLYSAEEIVSDYNREESLRKDYEGRQIYELLQNADDEAEDVDGDVFIELDGTKLTIKNTGTPFSFRGIKSLMHPNASPKLVNENKIGNKGLGFRAILNWTDSIKILTKDFCVEFSKDYAKSFFKKITEENNALLPDIKLLTKQDFPVSLLSCPCVLDEGAYPDDGYDTVIVFDCNEDLIDEIQNEIQGLTLEELIFLKNLKIIHIKTKDTYRTIEKIEVDGEVFLREKNELTGIEEERNWKIFKTQGEIEVEGKLKTYEFIIAYNEKYDSRNNVLYSYFKTDVEMPFPALIHGTFELSSDRNNLIKGSEVNKILIEKLVDFMIETAVKISLDSGECGYAPLQLLTSDLSSFTLDTYYDFNYILGSKLRTAKILPTISNTYLSVEDRPKYSISGFECTVNPEKFPELLKNEPAEPIRAFIQNLNLGFYSQGELCNRINSDLDYYSLEDKCELISCFKDEYKYPNGDIGAPYLLVDIKGNAICDKEKVYPLSGGKTFIGLPDWVKIHFLNDKMEQLLRKEFKISGQDDVSVRQFAQSMSLFNVDEYSFEKVLRNLNGQIASEELTIDNCREVLIWLYSCYKNGNKFPSGLKIKVIGRNGELLNASECYFGNEYKNVIGENVLAPVTDNFIANKNTLGLGSEAEESVKEFLKWLGVRKYPRVIYKSITGDERSAFDKYHQEISSEYICDNGESYKWEEFSISECRVATFERLNEILANSNFEDILAWFIADRNAQNMLSLDEEIYDGSFIKGKKGSQYSLRTISHNNMRSYFRWRLKNINWVRCCDGNKHATSKCCFTDYGISPLIVVPEYDLTIFKELCGTKAKRQVDDVLSKSGVADSICDMDKRTIFRILLQLHEVDTDCTKGSKIYNELIKQLENIDKLSYGNAEYSEFVRSGKVLCKHNGEKAYMPIKSVRYTDNKIFSGEILKKFNMLYVNARSGEGKVEKILGVLPLKNVNISLAGEVIKHPCNADFQEIYKQFLPYVYACRLMVVKKAQKDLKNLKNTRVLLVSIIDIKFSFGGEEFISKINDFEIAYITKDNTAYIKVPTTYSDIEKLKSNVIEFSAAVSEVVTNILDVDGDREFFRDMFTRSKSARDYIMRNDRGDEELIYLKQAMEELKINSDIKSDFWRIVADCLGIGYKDESEAEILVNGTFDIGECNIDFSNISSLKSLGAIVTLFNKLDIDIDEYNIRAINEINLIPYWKRRFIDLKLAIKNKYYSYLYKLGVNKEVSIEEFVSLLSKYSFTDAPFVNSVKEDIYKKFNNLFGVSVDELNTIQTADKKVLDAMSGSLDLMRTAELLGREDELEQQNDSQSLDDNSEECEQDDEPEDKKVNDIEPANIGRTEFESKTHYDGKPRGGFRAEDLQKTKLRNGLLCEKAVLEKLQEKYKAKWVSGYSKEYGNPEGSDDYGYDIEYVDESGEVIFVEVKSSTSDKIEFSMTQNEIDVGRANKNRYKVIFVNSGANPLVPLDLGYIFDFDEGEELFDNSKFAIKAKEYILLTKKR